MRRFAPYFLLALVWGPALVAQDLLVTEGAPYPAGALITDDEAVGGLRDYGFIAPSTQSHTLVLHFRNNRASDIAFGLITKTGAEPNHFFVNASGFLQTLPPGQATSLTIVFYRTTPGHSTATINVPHDAGGSGSSPFDINLRGTAALPEFRVSMGLAWAAPLTHDQLAPGTDRDYGMHDVNSGPTTARTFFITNTTAAAFSYSAPALAGPWWSQFVMPSGLASGVLAPGHSVSFTVAFDPTLTGAADCYLMFVHSCPATVSPFRVPLYGTGVGSQPATALIAVEQTPVGLPHGSLLDLGSIPAGQAQTMPFLARSIGGDPLVFASPSPLLFQNVSGCNVAVLQGPGAYALPAATSTTFAVSVEATVHGAFSFEMLVYSNSTPPNPYLITVTGRGVVTPSALTLLTPLGTAVAGVPLPSPPVLAVTDTFGYVYTDDFTTTVIVSIVPTTGSPGAVLAGAASVTVAGGIATFHNLQINLVGAGYQLYFQDASSTLTPATSPPFDVVAAPQPAGSTDGSTGCSMGAPLQPLPPLLLLTLALPRSLRWRRWPMV
ncbi:MAG: choice-of-anchor D domain-containing protein [Planctomycetes bacterium]|nr:choice-of-anchor D domain-containing protein [Planctomycetota bacterium]